MVAWGQGGGSPFLPPGFGAAASAQPSAGPLDSLEFRGVLTLSGRTFVTLFDTNGSRTFTAEVGETVNNIKVSSYRFSGEDDVIVVESGGRTRNLTLRKAKIVAMAVPPPTATPLPAGTPPGPPMPGQPGQVGQPVQPGQLGSAPGTITQMSDEEVRQRMQRVAEEIRRRRAVRREMLESTPTQ
jgi:hypothetical protein